MKTSPKIVTDSEFNRFFRPYLVLFFASFTGLYLDEEGTGPCWLFFSLRSPLRVSLRWKRVDKSWEARASGIGAADVDVDDTLAVTANGLRPRRRCYRCPLFFSNPHELFSGRVHCPTHTVFISRLSYSVHFGFYRVSPNFYRSLSYRSGFD